MPGKRSDPKKLAADREAIARSMATFSRRERVDRSRDKAQKAAKAYAATGEGTMSEAYTHMLDEADEKRHVRKYGGRPSREGATVTGRRKGSDAA